MSRLITLELATQAFEAWETAFRQNPDQFYSAEDWAAMEVATVAQKQAIHFLALLRNADEVHSIVKARYIAQGLTAFEALRLVWADDSHNGSEAAWAAFTDGLELLKPGQIQQRLAAQGIEITLDAAADLRLEAIAKRPGGVVAVIGADDEHAAAAVDVCDGALHDALPDQSAIVGDAEAAGNGSNA